MKDKEIIKVQRKLLINYTIIIFLFCILILGMVLNNIVIKANKGRMPVKSDFNLLDSNGIHQEFENFSDMNYPILSDRFQIGNIVFSIGDFIIIISLFLIGVFSIYSAIIEIKFIVNNRRRK